VKIIIDLQGAQAENCKRGIGRYSLSLALAMVRNRGSHDIEVALNGCFPDSIEFIKNIFSQTLEPQKFHVWESPSSIGSLHTGSRWMRESAELMRESFLASLKPDILHVTSLFEGFVDDAITSIRKKDSGNHFPIAVTLYDLIPLIFRDTYLKNPKAASWYNEKLEHLKRADLLLGISQSSVNDAIKYLDIPKNKCINISSDADEMFKKLKISPAQEKSVREKYNLNQAFVMYGGGIDYRKNIEALIRAYSKLPLVIRKKHQLGIVCSVQEEARLNLMNLASSLGMRTNELVLTGYVPDEDLVALYNICSLFIFPSWYEGFGLPILEAMRCGAPVIGGNTSSMPEIIGSPDALFDPRSEEAIVCILTMGLTDRRFQENLRRNGKQQADRFSWDKSACDAIAAMETIVKNKKRARPNLSSSSKLNLAYVSPMFPQKSGISFYSEELVPLLSKHYNIEIIVPLLKDKADLLQAKFTCAEIRTYEEFSDSYKYYDRIVYHFGNSDAHIGMFNLLEQMPGVVVLHDFYLSGIYHYMEQSGYSDGAWTKELYNSHGYWAFGERFSSNVTEDVVWSYPCSLSVIQSALGVIVHSKNSINLSRKYYGKQISNYHLIPHLRALPATANRLDDRKILGISPKEFLVCSFGIVGKHKMSQRLCDAWQKSDLAEDPDCKLVFVGQNAPGDYGEKMGAYGGNIEITGWASQKVYRSYLSAADLAVQLRTLSRGETSGAVLDCMSFGLPTIVNEHGGMADLDKETVMMISDKFDDNELVAALNTLWKNHKKRSQIGGRAFAKVANYHQPEKCAKLYRDAIEEFYIKPNSQLNKLINDRGLAYEKNETSESGAKKVATCLALNFPQSPRKKVIFLDISELVQRNVGTGIQRVVTMILREALNQNKYSELIRIEPVYASNGQGYKYARNFTASFIGYPTSLLKDEPIDYKSGDLFLGLDLQPQIVVANRLFYKRLRNRGVAVRFVVYDLLCVLQPEHFPAGAAEGFAPWLDVVNESDGIICISRSVAKEYKKWFSQNTKVRNRNFDIDWFHLGADIKQLSPETNLQEKSAQILATLRLAKTFLMVGTVEPRKGHYQVLKSFEILWSEGININLVIVGKQGWMVDELCAILRAHPELDKRLFWLEGISDTFLEKVYAVCSCLLAASHGEGFGLPLIEAAQNKLPILARDIPVFREVAGRHAAYFKAEETKQLVAVIKSWLIDYQTDNHTLSTGMRFLTWKESAAILLKKLSKCML
jgi:glycosyltransferase involved in cell wall biosynthesis